MTKLQSRTNPVWSCWAGSALPGEAGKVPGPHRKQEAVWVVGGEEEGMAVRLHEQQRPPRRLHGEAGAVQAHAAPRGIPRPEPHTHGAAGPGGRRVLLSGRRVGFRWGQGRRLTVGAASSSMRPQVEALFSSRSEMTPARIPPAMQRGRGVLRGSPPWAGATERKRDSHSSKAAAASSPSAFHAPGAGSRLSNAR